MAHRLGLHTSILTSVALALALPQSAWAADTLTIETQHLFGGAVRLRYHTVDGKREGVSERFYRSGKLRQRNTYVAGRTCGVQTKFSRRGVILSERTIGPHGRLQGMSRFWYPDGILQDSIIYENGWEKSRHSYYRTGELRYWLSNKDSAHTQAAQSYTKTRAIVGEVVDGDGYFLLVSEDQKALDNAAIVKDGVCVGRAPIDDIWNFILFVSLQVAHSEKDLYLSTSIREPIIRKIKSGSIVIRGIGTSEASPVGILGYIWPTASVVIVEYYFLSEKLGQYGTDWRVVRTRSYPRGKNYYDVVTVSGKDGVERDYVFDIGDTFRYER